MSADATDIRLTPALTPHGRFLIVPQDDAPELDPTLATRIRKAFDDGSGYGLLQLGAAEVGQVLPPVFAYWRELSGRFVTALCTRPDSDGRETDFPPPPADLDMLALASPLMPGAEYLTAEGQHKEGQDSEAMTTTTDQERDRCRGPRRIAK